MLKTKACFYLNLKMRNGSFLIFGLIKSFDNVRRQFG